MKYWTNTLLALSLALSANTWSSDETLEQQRLLDAMRERDLQATLTKLDNVRTLRYQGKILPVVEAIWLGDATALTGVPKFMLEIDAVRIAAAGALVYAKRNGLIQLDTATIGTYARELARSGDAQVQHSALQVLGQLDNPEDVLLISEIGTNGKPYEFRSAAIALTLMCAEQARAALVALGQARQSKSDRIYIADSLKTHDELRNLACGKFN